jgi:hypothetical protein
VFKASIRALAVGLAAALAVAVPAVGIAHAGGDNPMPAQGKLIKTTWSYSFATKASKKIQTFRKGTHVYVLCKLNGVPVDGNKRWYNLADDYNATQWVPARYVTNIGPAPKACSARAELAFGKVIAKPSLTKRAKPTSKSAAKGTIRYGTKVDILCKTTGPKVGGNALWYQLTNGRWVTARYVDNLGRVPEYCYRLH